MTRILIILSLTISIRTFSQNIERQVIASASGTENNTLSYTIGETIVSQSAGLVIGFNNFNFSPVTGLEKEDNHFQFFPNPTTGAFYVKDNQSRKINKVTVINCIGLQITPPIDTENEVITVDLSAFPSGTYLVRIDNRVHKIIKY